MRKRVSVKELKEYCEQNQPKQVTYYSENQDVSHLRPMQTQDALPNYVDMRKPQPDLLEVRDEHSLFRQSLFRGN